MQIHLTASADTYITNRYISSFLATGSNVGRAGTLDLFKLYGVKMSGSTPLTELSRLLVKFDLAPLRTAVSEGRVSITDSSFKAYMRLKDVYGGQPPPMNFTAVVMPCSRSWEEGLGKDVTRYQDLHAANWVTAALNPLGLWNTTGANSIGLLGSSNIDVIGSASFGAGVVSTTYSQSFAEGTEDLYIDVTSAVSATVASQLPDYGFRISFSSAEETDGYTRFVKRFASRHSFNEALQPRLIIKYSDYIRDDGMQPYVDTSNVIYLRNYVRGKLANVMSGSTALTGANCVAFKLRFHSTGGVTNFAYTGSQLQTGIYYVTASVSSSNTYFKNTVAQSGTFAPTPIWSSLDGTVPYYTGSALVFSFPSAAGVSMETSRIRVSFSDLPSEVKLGENIRVRVSLIDESKSIVFLSRIPIEAKSVLYDEVYYAIRDVVTNEVVVDFDFTNGSTRLSNDWINYYFDLYTTGMIPGHSYAIDIAVKWSQSTSYYRSSSPLFRIVK